MKCLNCGGRFEKIIGTLLLNDKIIGRFSVQNAVYKKCNQCHKIRYPAKTAKIIEKEKIRTKEKLIGGLPVNEFIGATAAADILNISRQAMHKHKRIRRGFIFSIKNEGRILYHKKSVELYKKYGDGRFPLGRSSSLKRRNYKTPNVSKTKSASWVNILDPKIERQAPSFKSIIIPELFARRISKRTYQ